MWFTIIRLLFWLILLIIIWSVIRKSKLELKLKKMFLLLLLIVAVIGYILSGFFIVENYFITFQTPESAFKYVSSGEIVLTLDGEHSTMVVSGQEITKSHSIFPKGAGGWKLDSGLGKKTVYSGIIERKTVYVYRYQDTNDYYIYIHGRDSELPEISDGNGSLFEQLLYSNETTEDYFYTYYAYIKNYDGHYELTINGETYALDF